MTPLPLSKTYLKSGAEFHLSPHKKFRIMRGGEEGDEPISPRHGEQRLHKHLPHPLVVLKHHFAEVNDDLDKGALDKEQANRGCTERGKEGAAYLDCWKRRKRAQEPLHKLLALREKEEGIIKFSYSYLLAFVFLSSCTNGGRKRDRCAKRFPPPPREKDLTDRQRESGKCQLVGWRCSHRR